MAKKKQDKRQTIGESGLDTALTSISIREYDAIDRALDRISLVANALGNDQSFRLYGDAALSGAYFILEDAIDSIRDAISSNKALADMA